MKKYTPIYFNYSEFDSPDCKGSGFAISNKLVEKLDHLRSLYKKPIFVNSGVRTKAHNLLVGGLNDSSHLDGLAVDIHAASSTDIYQLVYYAFKVGFTRIGIKKNMIHLDIDKSKPAFVLWTYDKIK